MSWTGALAAIKANCTTAAADVSPAIDEVRVGWVTDLNRDAIAIVPSGTRAPGNTFGRMHLERGVEITVYLRGYTPAPAIDETQEARLHAIEDALFDRLYGDIDCGGNAIGLSIEGSTYGAVEVGTQWARTATFTTWVYLQAEAPITP